MNKNTEEANNIEKAIKTIEVAISEVEWNYPMEYGIAFVLAISALEKQIPKSVILGEDECICPTCGFDMMGVYDFYDRDTTDPKCCPNCGQALDWSEEE